MKPRLSILFFLLLYLISLPAFSVEGRQPNYFPDGRDIVCVNGTNRYTRALYGTHTAWRLETSDRPVFAAYKKGGGMNISFCVSTATSTVPLDNTTFCEARYTGGKRIYTLRDDSWGSDAEIRIETITACDCEGAVWRITQRNMPKNTKLISTVCEIRDNHFVRGGDLGKDDLTKFEASAAPSHPSAVFSIKLSDKPLYLLYNEPDAPIIPTALHRTTEKEWNRHEGYRIALTSRIVINTPDALLNTVGSILSHAADGYWDGSTWLHGCVGWRTPLAGWRGAYAGDALGWFDRSHSHFSAYAKSQVTDVPATIPHPSQDAEKGLSRAEKRWGTQMYSNGYICRNPERNNQMHHYDMNLNYIDGLLWHLSYDADTLQMREFWPVLTRHLEWERRNFDPDGDHLYDAYCCIWASDALYYNGGAVTHSSAYNYRANRLAARIAEILGEDPTPYATEASEILKAMNERLWMPDRGTWCEYQDLMGLKRQHPSAALWSIYIPIDCGACSSVQAYQATQYVDRDIPHVGGLLSTTDWHPYVWSTNNVAHEEVANMALAYFKAGRSDSGFTLLMNDLKDEMLDGASPGNFGQISYYDKVLKECYRDFADNVGITSRAIINGLFGIQPDALYGRCIIHPALPDEWNEAEIKTPYLSYSFRREGTKDIYEIRQQFPRPLQIIVRTNAGGGAYLDVDGNSDTLQTIIVDRTQLPAPYATPNIPASKEKVSAPGYIERMGLADVTPFSESRHSLLDISSAYNANVDDIFKNEYLSPRPPYTTLQIPVHGIGQWCHPEWMAEIEDDGLRRCINDGIFDTHHGVQFRIPKDGNNIAYTSLWDNYPDSITIPIINDNSNVCAAYLMLAGSTNNMQSRIDNGIVVATYSDNTTDTLHLENPINWCPIEQDYVIDDAAFWSAPLKPLRFRLDNGYVSREINEKVILGTNAGGAMGDESPSGANADRVIHHGAGVILKMPLNPKKNLRTMTLRTLSNDVVIGIMGITLEQDVPDDMRENTIVASIRTVDFPDHKYTVNTACSREELQSIIDRCSANGGGKVIVHAGVYHMDGPLNMKSNVNLHLSDGATLQFSSNPDDYLPAVLSRWEGTELYGRSSMIHAHGQTNIAITGEGSATINCGGSIMAKWGMPMDTDVFKENIHGTHGITPEKADVDRLRQMGDDLTPVAERVFAEGTHLRPCGIEFNNCKQILIDGITLKDSPFWCIHPLYCEDVIVRNVTIDSHFPNNDGCDPESSRRILIENCTFRTGDDAIAIKSGRDADGRRVGRPSEDIVIRNCKFYSECNGLCIGSEMSGGVRNVIMRNIEIGNVKNALLFKSNLDRGGFIESVFVDSVTIKSAAGAVLRFETNYFGYRGGNFPARYFNFNISNVTADRADSYAIYFDGNASEPITNINVNNFTVHNARNAHYLYKTRNCTFRNCKVNNRKLPLHIKENTTRQQCDVW